MKVRAPSSWPALALALPQVAQAQTALSSDANAAVQITEARKANDTLMRQYTWNSRTEIIENGQVKDIRIELNNYAPDGTLQRSLLNDTEGVLTPRASCAGLSPRTSERRWRSTSPDCGASSNSTRCPRRARSSTS